MQRIREMSFQLNQIAYIMWYTSDSRENCVRTSMESVVMWGLSVPTSIKLNFHFVIIYGHKDSHQSTVLLWLFPGKKGRHFSYCTWKRPWLCGLMNAYDVHFWPTSKLLRLKLMVLASQPYILLVNSFLLALPLSHRVLILHTGLGSTFGRIIWFDWPQRHTLPPPEKFNFNLDLSNFDIQAENFHIDSLRGM